MNEKFGEKLHYETVTPRLLSILKDLMRNPLFDPFRLVGGTSLSLRLGHRISADIDLFTDAAYGSLDFSLFEDFFRQTYPYYDCVDKTHIVGLGRSYFIGESKDNNIKVDLYYHDGMVDPLEIIDGIRMAGLKDITAMKIDVVSRGGRKKDFWDIHELLNTYSIPEMLQFHQQRFEYTHHRKEIISNFTNFSTADEDIDPICLMNKAWELIKLDLFEAIEALNK